MNDTAAPAKEPTPEEKEAADRAKAERKRVAASFSARQLEGMRGMSFAPQNFEEVWFLANVFASSGTMVPENFRGNPEAAAMAVMWGLELGVSPLQAIQGIAVIGGRPAVWGDLAHALVLTHPEFESFAEHPIIENGQIIGYQCTTKRKNFDAVTRMFTTADAARAGLIQRAETKGGPWRDYRPRMLQMRARSWAHRDAMPHALRGLAVVEELLDVEGRVTATSKPGQDLAGNPLEREEIPMPRELAHEAPDPLLDVRVTKAPETAAVDFKDLEDKAEFPDAGLTKAEVAADDALAEELRARVRGATPAQSSLLGDAPRKTTPTPLSVGSERTLQAYLDATDGRVTRADVQDELGSDITQENLPRALEWITNESAKRRET